MLNQLYFEGTGLEASVLMLANPKLLFKVVEIDQPARAEEPLPSPNYEGLAVMHEIMARHKGRSFADKSDTVRLLHEARATMFYRETDG